MKLTGSEIIIRCLLEQGVDTVFGYPGGTILNVYDALVKFRKQIRHIRTSHEQGASHAADGYARASGKVGVCFATSGPGATNLVTGLATAYMDSIPVVAITCNVTNQMLGKDSFQEVDIAGITMPITKHGVIVKDINLLADAIRRAFTIATSGRPGPVIVDITKDTTAALCEYTPVDVSKNTSRKQKKKWTDDDIRNAVSMIEQARKPMLFVGGGAVLSGASAQLKTLIEKTDAPVCNSLMGKGAFDERKDYYTGLIGMHGTKTSNLAVSECDLLVALGARFSDRVTGNPKTFAAQAKILHIDVDPAEINKNIKADAWITGDLKTVLKDLNAHLKQQHHPKWMQEIHALQKKYPLKAEQGRLTGPMIVEALYRKTKGDAVITTDVGQHQMWTAQFYRFHKPRTFLSSGGLGTMGYGLGACIGAKVANPAKTCINITGDGCFRMNMQELLTASGENIPVIEIVFHNKTLGMVRQWQTLFYNEKYSATTIADNADYCMIARGMGCDAYRVENETQLEDALNKALKAKKTVLIDCMIDTDDKVFPMVPAGGSVADVFDETDLKKRNG